MKKVYPLCVRECVCVSVCVRACLCVFTRIDVFRVLCSILCLLLFQSQEDHPANSGKDETNGQQSQVVDSRSQERSSEETVRVAAL